MPVYDNLFVRKVGGRSRFAAKAIRGVADWASRPRFNCGCTCAQRYPTRSAESNWVACRRSEPMMTLPRSAAQVLSGHVTLEIRCIDRMLLTFRQPRLQYGKGIHGFFCHHRGNQFVSSALMHPMTKAFAADIP